MPMLCACHVPLVLPVRARSSKRAVTWVAICWAVIGEVTNRPTLTVAGRRGSWVLPMRCQLVPSVESYPVIVSPLRRSCSHRGLSAVTTPGRPGWSPV